MTYMRNRKLLHGASNGDASLPIYNHRNTSTTDASATTTRRHRSHRSKQRTIASSFVSICCFIIVASVCIISFHHLQHTSNRHVPRFLASALKTENNNMDAPSDITYDIAILGAGPAGLTASIFGARAGLKVLVLGSQSGLLAETPRLENFPGYYDKTELGIPGTGEHWLQTTRSQAKSLGAYFALPGLMASSLDAQQNIFALKTQLDTFHSRAVVVATGATSRRLNLPLEDDLWGNSLHNCAICDGHMYKGKTVVVVGGGDAAIDAAIYLSRQAQKVYLVHRRQSFDKVRAQSTLDLLRQTVNVEMFTPFVVNEWLTSSSAFEDNLQLTGVAIKNAENDQVQNLNCDGAFLMIGADANTAWLSNTLPLDDHGLIRLNDVHQEQEASSGMTTATSLPGVFAAGEVTDSQYRQAITAAAAGAQAALDAERWLRQQTNANDQSEIIQKDKKQKTRLESSPPMEGEQVSRQEKVQENESQPQQEDDCDDLTNEDCISKIVKTYPVVVFSKPWCPYCRKALEALAIAGMSNPHVIDLSQQADTQAIQSTLQQMTGRRTVPNVFVGGKSIGGGDETASFQITGQLKPLLEEAGAFEISGKQVKNDFGPPRNGDYGCNLATDECITKILTQYPLVLFSLSWCPECHRMFELLSMAGISKPHVIDLDDRPDIKLDIRQQLLTRAGSKKVPSLFIGGEALGDFRKVNELFESGELGKKLQRAGL